MAQNSYFHCISPYNLLFIDSNNNNFANAFIIVFNKNNDSFFIWLVFIYTPISSFAFIVTLIHTFALVFSILIDKYINKDF